MLSVQFSCIENKIQWTWIIWNNSFFLNYRKSEEKKTLKVVFFVVKISRFQENNISSNLGRFLSACGVWKKSITGDNILERSLKRKSKIQKYSELHENILKNSFTQLEDELKKYQVGGLHDTIFGDVSGSLFWAESPIVYFISRL